MNNNKDKRIETQNLPGNTDPIFILPPYLVDKVFIVASETIDWGLRMLNVPSLWQSTKGHGVKIAILDTGIDNGHPDLQGAILEARDFTGSAYGSRDVVGHGTHVAGIIAARQNNVGVVGVAPESSLLIAKVLGDNGSGSAESIAEGIYWAIQRGANIISMSLGSNYPMPIIETAIKEALRRKVFVICAAGNSGPAMNTVGYPGAYVETVCVGSIDQARRISVFSSRGKQVDIVAPGDKILSTYLNYGYASLSGTSMATPVVSGIVALMLAAGMNIKDQNELVNSLIQTATDLGSPGFDHNYGYGLINPADLLNYQTFPYNLALNLADFSSTGQNKIIEFMDAAGFPNYYGKKLNGILQDEYAQEAGEIEINL